ncbi:MULTISPECIES: NAD(P)-dependent oxidoreductase [unclassified Streptomyces]|uniref:NAD-dependent epimerase/dehydratase family protein n=1 Tax=unclassified Streptomyces TaxID=2593676 RepID=UPI0019D14D7C|nr:MULTISPECIES: NAD-dependent epimerase/dehydratase family protein [unclassified Streptomyces]MCX5099066.1 NAD(P)-dependent oxidoreductase [Streptomyces sp. NBC_00439]WSG49339.1 NAD(P)-dependent oxidoreductase [Streptomyces sp. NBC_01732]WSP50554.1 NAD(P)-dependent oxidoreductase [Streptomyces sp. NBC_01243]WSW99992.1 NAD(P)-dependent oxidoreductase [Streptomyces sp. NBC_00987]
MSRGNAWVLGATGQIGRVAVRSLVEDGWEVTAASLGGGRDAGWDGAVRTTALDRNADGALAAALGDGCDVLVDMVAYDAGHARQLTGLADRIGSAVVISSGATYEDDRGRSFDTQGEPDGAPHYPVPIPESQRTVPAGGMTYATRKIELERDLLAAGDALPVTLLRAGAIHGKHCRSPRELFFVKRLVDGRDRRVLAFGGESRFHPVHVSNLAELIRLAALRPGSRVLNAGDPQAPTVTEIGEAVDAVLGRSTSTVLSAGPPGEDGVGGTPWSSHHPIVYDMTAAERELGYRPVTGYVQSLPETVEWIAARLVGQDWTAAFPAMLRSYGKKLFDYAAEDAWLAAYDRRG